MAKPLLPAELWAIIAPLLPPLPPVGPRGGRPPVPHRAALTGILFVLKTGIPWEDLPVEMGCGSGMTCWRRVRDWQADGTWDNIHRDSLARLRRTDGIDWSRVLIDSSTMWAAHGVEGIGPSPVDQGKPGTKHYAVTDASGTPPAGSVTPADRDYVTDMAPLVNKLPRVAGNVGL